MSQTALIYTFDLLGTLIFAVTGAVSAIHLRLDLLGVIVFGCIVGVGGGVLRDTIIGAVPVAALQNENYLLVCILMTLIIFFVSPKLVRYREIIAVCDAFGLGVFTAIGAAKGMQFGLGPIGVMLSGVLSAVGGGVLRDVLSRKIPAVLVSDFYATASLLGGALFYVLMRFTGLPHFSIFTGVAALVTVSRLLAIHFKLKLPSARRKCVKAQRP